MDLEQVASTKRMRGQSATELLKTYGLALLVIAIVLAALYALGALNPKNTQTSTCIFSSGHSCNTFSIANGSGSLSLDLGQSTGKPVIITAAGCTQSGAMAFKNLKNAIAIPSGEHRWVLGGDSGNAFNCTDENGAALGAAASQIGEYYKGRACVIYYNSDTFLDTIVCGDLNARFEPGPEDTGGPQTPNYPACAPEGVISSCPCVLNATANYRLESNLASAEKCITITADANGSTLDCKDFAIQGQNSGDGILIGGASRITVRRCALVGFGNGIRLLDSSGNTITNNTAVSNSNHGILVGENSYRNSITRNTAESNGECGIYLNSSADYNTVSNNIANSNAHGIQLYGASFNTLLGNNASKNALSGISTEGNSQNNSIISNTASENQNGIYIKSGENTISGNIASSNRICGITLLSAMRCNVTGNSISGTESDGIVLFDSTENRISSNTVGSSKRHGIWLTLGSKGNILSSNILSSNLQSGMQLDSSGSNSIVGNKFDSNGGNGIYLTASDDCNITGNTAVNNSESGISATGSAYLTISSNTLRLNLASGIHASLANSTISGNTASSNYNGMELVSTTGCEVSGNTVNSNWDYGIRVLSGSSGNRFARNTVCNNPSGNFRCEDGQIDGGANACGPATPQCLSSIPCQSCPHAAP